MQPQERNPYNTRHNIETWQDYLRTDYAQMQDELGEIDRNQTQPNDSIQALRIHIDSELESTIQELGELQAQLPKEQSASLFQQCADNALNAVVGHFGLAAAVLDSKDGGNVTTTHNFEQGITATKDDAAKYEHYKSNQEGVWREVRKQEGYDSPLPAMRKETFKTQDKVYDEYTGKELPKDGRAQIDHIVSAKEIDSDPRTHLFLSQEERAKLATNEKNLAWTDGGLNNSKDKHKMGEWLERADKKGGTKADRFGVDREKALAKDKEARDHKDSTLMKAQIKKQGTEILATGAKDAGKMALHSVIGIVLHDLIKGMMIEIKILVKEFGNESFKEIFTRFKNRLQTIWEDLKAKWKDIIAGSLESAILSFFSNILVFVINTIFTTLKKIVQIIRAGFNSLYKAIKILVNPPKDMPKDEVMREAAKVLVSGLIAATTMLGAAAMTEMLEGLCPALKTVRLPFAENETILGAVALCLTAALGAILSTIAIYYIDKWASDSKESRLQLQIMGKSGEIVQLKVAQSWFVLHDAWQFTLGITQSTINKINEAQEAIAKSSQETKESFSDVDSAMAKLRAFRMQHN